MTDPESLLSAGDAGQVAEFLKSLCHPQRLMIVCALVEGELGVADLERGLAIRQPSLSQHLGSLREAEIISSRKAGKMVFYRLSDPRAAKLIETLHSIFCAPKQREKARSRVAHSERRPTLAHSGKAPTDPIRARPSESAVFAQVGQRGQP